MDQIIARIKTDSAPESAQKPYVLKEINTG